MTEESKKGVTHNQHLSDDIVLLYNSAEVDGINEAVTVLFHGLLLESGFTIKDVKNEDKYQFMPENWKVNGAFKFSYVHCCCPSFTCCVTFVPLYNMVSVHGIICDADCTESVNFKVNLKTYLKQIRSKNQFSKVFDVFCNLDALSRHLKDNFCLPLLNLLHETIGKRPLYGIQGLMDELKIFILQYLPVEGVVSMSGVNKNYHDLANSSLLWKHLYKRDFCRDSLAEAEPSCSEPNWKQMYKKEYLKKKRNRVYRSSTLPYIFSPTFPHLFPIGPDHPDYPEFDIGCGINFDPPFPGLYPEFLQPRSPLFRRLL